MVEKFDSHKAQASSIPDGSSSSSLEAGKPKQRKGKLRHAGALVEGLTKRAVGRRGFAQASILTDWSIIIGADLAKFAQPERLSFPQGKRAGGTLYIRAPGPMALQLQHLAPMVVSRINAHFGYSAVDTVKIIQGALKRPPVKKKPPTRALSDEERHRLAQHARGLDADAADPDLTEALARLGERIAARS